MKRLIHDASQMTGVQDKLNIKVKDGDMSFANIANAISVMQENLGIAGTTAEEAEKTFSGSFNQMKAAAQNLLGYMANGMDIGPALNQLITSASTFFFGNFLPMIGRVVLAIPGVLTNALNTFADKLRTAGASGIGGFLSGLMSQLPALAAAAGNLIAAFVQYVVSHAGEFAQIAHQCVVAFVDGLSEIIPMSEETVKNLPGVIEGALKGLAAVKAISYLTGPVKVLTGSLKGLGPAFTGLKTNAKTFFGLMQSGGGVVSNLALMASQGEGALAGLATSFVNAGGGASGLLAVLKVAGSSLLSAVLSPVTLIAAAVVGLGAAFAHLWTTNEEFRAKMAATWEGLVSAFNGFIQGILDRINEFGFNFQSIGELISTIWNGVCSLLAPVFEAAWNTIASVLEAAMDIITGILDVFIGLFTGDWSQFWTGIQEIASGIWDGICAMWSGFWESLTGISDAFLGLFGTSWSELWNGLQQAASAAWNGITSILSGIWNGLIGIASAAWNGIKTAITTPINAAKDAVSSVFNAIKSTCDSIWSGVKSAASTAWNAVKTAIMTPINAAKDAVSKAVGTMKSVFNNCSLRLPHIPLPHFSITGKFSLMPPSIPHFGVSWYAKGGILDGATIFGAKGNRLLGGGEAGPEAVLPLADFYSHLDKSLESAGASDDALDRVIALLTIIADKAEKEIYMDRKMVGKLISEDIQSSIEERKWMRAKVVGGTV